MDSGTTSVHTELKPRAKAKPTVYGRYRIAVGGRAVGCACSLGHSGSKGASVQERWGGVSSSLGMPLSGNELQTQSLSHLLIKHGKALSN